MHEYAMKQAITNAAVFLTAFGLLLTAVGATADETAKGCSRAALVKRAADAEKAGRADEAIRAYEELLRQNPSFMQVAAPRLVELYTASQKAPQALAWARKIAPGRPDPQAYLAGVYAALGQFKEAEMLLRQTLAAAENEHQRLPLLWQLADVQEQQGDCSAALATLNAACSDIGSDMLLKTSRERLSRLQARQRTRTNDTEAQP